MNVSIMNKIYIYIGILLLSIFAYSCKEDDHYEPKTSIVPDEDLMEIIENYSEVSTFVKWIKDVEYDFVLSSDLSYTVWAPNNAALEGITFESEEDKLHFVTNHIARFTQSASGNFDKNILMINTKLISYKNTGSTYFLGDAVIESPNHVASNGILHILDGKVDYVFNLWETMTLPELDSIKDFLYPLTKREFNLNNSEIIGFNPEGLPEYDSIFNDKNPFWDSFVPDLYTNGIAGRFQGGFFPVNNEDSLYTMILPTNTAWIKAYDEIFPYFVNNYANADSLQRYCTQFAIVQDLVFRGKIDPNAAVLRSTRLATFPDPSYLFEGASKELLSNGEAYVVDELRYKPLESWNKDIKIEAENYGSRNTPPLYNEEGLLLFEGTTLNVFLENVGASGEAYMYVFQERTRTTAAEFLIPNNLATSYKITCVFMPDIYINSGNNVRKTKVKFSIMQLDTETNEWQIIESGGGPGNPIVPGEIGEVSATDITYMVVHENFKFPYAFINENTVRDSPLKIRVETTITRGTETGEYANRMSIDYLLLEPVND